jgi:hypothetical protein
MTLLEEVKKIKVKSQSHDKITDEEIELAVAFANNEVSFAQIRRVIKKQHSHIAFRMMSAIKKGVEDEKIVVTHVR